MKKEKIHCAICQETMAIDPDEVRYTIEGYKACLDCYNRAFEEGASRVMSAIPDEGVDNYAFDGDFGMQDAPGELPEPIKKQIWVNTDGWRGYTDWILHDGWTKLADGWVTGFTDGSTERKKDLSDYFDAISEGQLVPPVPLYWLFGTTSNIFSNTSTIICKTADVETLKKWLDEVDGGLEHFQDMLS